MPPAPGNINSHKMAKKMATNGVASILARSRLGRRGLGFQGWAWVVMGCAELRIGRGRMFSLEKWVLRRQVGNMRRRVRSANCGGGPPSRFPTPQPRLSRKVVITKGVKVPLFSQPFASVHSARLTSSFCCTDGYEGCLPLKGKIFFLDLGSGGAI